jgi:hypothetical protein
MSSIQPTAHQFPKEPVSKNQPLWLQFLETNRAGEKTQRKKFAARMYRNAVQKEKADHVRLFLAVIQKRMPSVTGIKPSVPSPYGSELLAVGESTQTYRVSAYIFAWLSSPKAFQ